MVKEEVRCVRCRKENIKLEKWIFGRKNRWKKVVKIICLECGFREARHIDQRLFKLTRKLRWRHKNKKLLEKEGLDYLLIN